MKRIMFLFLSLAIMCNVAEARPVSGKVVCGREKLSDVIVTDGQNFTKTVNGKFKFEIADDAEFVYIVTPAGYVADWSTGVPAFFQAAQGKDKFTFELSKTKASEGYSIVAMADPQTKTMNHFEQFSAEPLTDLCQTAQGLENVAVGLALGDICWDKLELMRITRRRLLQQVFLSIQ